jgi:hypothetical protein
LHNNVTVPPAMLDIDLYKEGRTDSHMNVYEAIGVGWVIFTSLLATVGMVYFAYVGVKISIEKRQRASANEIPDEVRKMFKIV